jgi:hypothetical protein
MKGQNSKDTGSKQSLSQTLKSLLAEKQREEQELRKLLQKQAKSALKNS